MAINLNQLALSQEFLSSSENKTSEAVSFNDSLLDDFTTSSRTAIARRAPSAPLKHLLTKGMIPNHCSILHYGKGKSDHDSNAMSLLEGARVVDYDYTFCPNVEVLRSTFDVIVSCFVVNTLPIDARNFVWQQMSQLCKQGGVVFVAARSNADRGVKGTPHEDGFITSIKTFQKKYFVGDLASEAAPYFKHVEEIKGCKGAFRIVKCSN